MIRLIDERELETRLREILAEADSELNKARGQASLRRWIMKQPELCLVSATGAAGILGIAPPHLARLRKRDRMPAPLPVEGGYDVYLRGDVEQLARELKEERK